MERIKGLDSLRFVMAFIVLLGHGTLPFINIPVIGSEYNELINGLLGNSTVGVAAVLLPKSPLISSLYLEPMTGMFINGSVP